MEHASVPTVIYLLQSSYLNLNPIISGQLFNWLETHLNYLHFYYYLLLRLTATNGELTITKSHGPPPSHSSCSSSSNQATNHQHSSSMKLSPSSMQLSPTGTENSNTDMLSESPGNTNILKGLYLKKIV